MINNALGLIENASLHGPKIDNFLELIHWFMLVLFVGWTVYFFYCVVRFRQKSHPKASYSGATGKLSSRAEVVVVLIEAVLLLAFAIPLWASHVKDMPSEKEATQVRVIAQQFAWNIHYPGPDGVFGRSDVKFVDEQGNPIGLDRQDPASKDDIVTLNQLHLPVNKPAVIQLSSKDVIHSFALRQMRVLQDTIPGMVIPTWFTPIKEGSYEIACAQLCGNFHYRMKGAMTIESQETFDAWLKQQAAEAGAGNAYE
jgi:cytochrome c oxidase subunit 2